MATNSRLLKLSDFFANRVELEAYVEEEGGENSDIIFHTPSVFDNPVAKPAVYIEVSYIKPDWEGMPAEAACKTHASSERDRINAIKRTSIHSARSASPPPAAPASKVVSPQSFVVGLHRGKGMDGNETSGDAVSGHDPFWCDDVQHPTITTHTHPVLEGDYSVLPAVSAKFTVTSAMHDDQASDATRPSRSASKVKKNPMQSVAQHSESDMVIVPNSNAPLRHPYSQVPEGNMQLNARELRPQLALTSQLTSPHNQLLQDSEREKNKGAVTRRNRNLRKETQSPPLSQGQKTLLYVILTLPITSCASRPKHD